MICFGCLGFGAYRAQAWASKRNTELKVPGLQRNTEMKVPGLKRNTEFKVPGDYIETTLNPKPGYSLCSHRPEKREDARANVRESQNSRTGSYVTVAEAPCTCLVPISIYIYVYIYMYIDRYFQT